MNKPAPVDPTVHDFIRQRWSPRAFADRDVEPDALRSLLQAAQWAPSAFNEQPWAFLVATRGEPHAANVVHTAAGPMLIDWDTVRWAPRERDLWSLVDQAGFGEGYGDTSLNAAALEVYRLQWSLAEIADFAMSLSTAPKRNPDREIAIRELRGYLGD